MMLGFTFLFRWFIELIQGEASTSSFAINLESRGRGNDKSSNQNKGRLKSRNGKSNSRSG